MVSVGELVYLGQEWRHDERECACGAAYEHCSFWGDAIQNEEDAEELGRLARRVDYRRVLPRFLTGGLSGQIQRRYRDRVRALFSYIAERGGAEWVVDSSKSGRYSAGRFLALQNIADLDVRVLHLVRDGRAVLRSVVEKGTNWAAEGYREEKPLLTERTILGWTLANGLAWSLGTALEEDRYLRVRFEDLLDHPELVLNEIGNFIGEDLSSIAERVVSDESFPVGHNVGGNRVRHEEQIRLRRKSAARRRRWEGLGRYQQLLFSLFGQWLNSSFGYDW
jgi:hypothetical protein